MQDQIVRITQLKDNHLCMTNDDEITLRHGFGFPQVQCLFVCCLPPGPWRSDSVNSSLSVLPIDGFVSHCLEPTISSLRSSQCEPFSALSIWNSYHNESFFLHLMVFLFTFFWPIRIRVREGKLALFASWLLRPVSLL